MVRHYLNILSVVSPKFNFELRPFGPVYNPAYLPRYDSDKFYLWESLPLAILQPELNYQVSPEISTYESIVVMTTGYLFPLGDKHGLDIAISWTHIISHINTLGLYDFMGQPRSSFHFYPDNWGIILGYGITISRILSLGIAFHPMIAIWGGSSIPESTTFQYSFSVGGLLTFVDGRLLWDFQFIYSHYPQYYAIESDQTIYEGKTPLIFETSVVGSAIPDKLYFSLKGNMDAYYDDRGGYYMRITPMTEFWPTRYLALRGGYLLSILDQMDTLVVGHGVTAGITLKIGKWEIDTAYSHSVTPVINVSGYLIPMNKLHFGLTRSGNFIGK